MKILASDFDLTIYFGDNEELNQKNVEAIRKFVSQGNLFCIITGRNYPSLKRRVDQYKIPYDYLICEDGAKLFKKDECFETTYLDKKYAKKVVEFLQKEKWNYTLDDGFGPINSFDNCVKIVVDCSDEDEKKHIVDSIKEHIPVHIYASRIHVNVIEKNVNKKNALNHLLEKEGFDEKQLYVIGDSDNDYEMIDSFNGAIIKKHHPKLNNIGKKEYEYFYQYIEELMKD